MDLYDDQFLKLLSHFILTHTHFTHEQTLLNMGNIEDFYAMMNTKEFENLLKIEAHQCKKYVMEFLATAQLHFVDPLLISADEGSISFFIKRKFYTMSLFRLCKFFGFSHHLGIEMFEMSGASELWELIGDLMFCDMRRKH